MPADGVLLGSWASVENAKQILDVGTGTGLIALMLAQRNASTVLRGIDVDKGAVHLGKGKYSKSSPWSDRVNVQEISLQQFTETSDQRFDLIVSNPPYFINSTKTPLENRTTARHTDTLTHEELIENAINC